MKKIPSLLKIGRLYQKKEDVLIEKCRYYQNEIAKEKKTELFLQTCLKEYNTKLHIQTQKDITAFEYQRFGYFIGKLKEALSQQSEQLMQIQKKYQAVLTEYAWLKNKSMQIENFIQNEQNKIAFVDNRKEQQMLTELYNTLNQKDN